MHFENKSGKATDCIKNRNYKIVPFLTNICRLFPKEENGNFYLNLISLEIQIFFIVFQDSKKAKWQIIRAVIGLQYQFKPVSGFIVCISNHIFMQIVLFLAIFFSCFNIRYIFVYVFSLVQKRDKWHRKEENRYHLRTGLFVVWI